MLVSDLIYPLNFTQFVFQLYFMKVILIFLFIFKYILSKLTISIAQYCTILQSLSIGVHKLNSLKSFNLNQLQKPKSLFTNNSYVWLIDPHNQKVLVRANRIDLDVFVIDMVFNSYLPETQFLGHHLHLRTVAIEQVIRAIVHAIA